MYHIITGIVSGGGLVAKSCPTLVTPWTVARQGHLFMGFSREEYWGWLPFPTSGGLPHLGIEPMSLVSPALAGKFSTTSTTWEAQMYFPDQESNLGLSGESTES